MRINFLLKNWLHYDVNSAIADRIEYLLHKKCSFLSLTDLIVS